MAEGHRKLLLERRQLGSFRPEAGGPTRAVLVPVRMAVT